MKVFSANKVSERAISKSTLDVRVGFGRLCSKKKLIMLLAVLIFFRNYAKIMLLLKIMLSVAEIMLLRFYTDFKENKDHQ